MTTEPAPPPAALQSAAAGSPRPAPSSKVKAKAASPDELISHLQALAERTPKRPSATAIFAALRVQDRFTIGIGEVQRVNQLLNTLDPNWEVRVQIASRGQAGSGIYRRLSAPLIQEAQTRSEYPSDASEPERRGDQVREWLQTALHADGGQAEPKPAAMLLTALLQDRETAFFKDAVIQILDASNKAKLLFTSTDFAKAAVDLIGRGQSGKKATSQALSLIQPLRDQLARLEARHAVLAGDAERSGRERDRLRTTLAHSEQVNVRLRSDLDAAEARVAELERNLHRSRELAVVREREALTGAASDLARLRSTVREVLSRNAVEMRLYLDRETPNVSGALGRLAHIEALVKELDSQGK